MSLIVIQAGHGGRTSGATGTAGEQAFTAKAAARARHHVQAVGHGVRVIQADPGGDSAYRGEAFFSIHADGNDNPAVRGASVGHRTPEGVRISRLWKNHYVRNGWSGGFRPDNYTPNLGGYYGVKAAVRQGNRFATIVEAGFLSSPADRHLMADPHGPDRVGIAIAAAVVDVFGGGGCPSAPAAPGLPAYPGTVRRGDRGPAVLAWQRELNRRVYGGGPHALVEDGDFGASTERIVSDFQSKRGLLVDGVAGPTTWHELVLG